jgi:hypothetical protein
VEQQLASATAQGGVPNGLFHPLFGCMFSEDELYQVYFQFGGCSPGP